MCAENGKDEEAISACDPFSSVPLSAIIILFVMDKTCSAQG